MNRVIAGIAFACVAFLQPAAGQCSKDIDCKGDRICVNGTCVDPAPAVPQPLPPTNEVEIVNQASKIVPVVSPEESEAPRGKIPEPGIWSIWINPVGFIQFGPTAGFEIRTAPYLYVGAHVRYAAMGMLYNTLLERRAQGDYYSSLNSIEVDLASAAAGAEGKYYIKYAEKPHMLYFGLFGEYMWGGYTAFAETYDYSDSSSNQADTAVFDAAHQSIGLGATFGHRWRLGESKKILFSVGLLTGVARPIVNTKTFRSAPNRKINVAERNEFIIMAEVALGYGI